MADPPVCGLQKLRLRSAAVINVNRRIRLTLGASTACSGSYGLLQDVHAVGNLLAFGGHPRGSALRLVGDGNEVRPLHLIHHVCRWRHGVANGDNNTASALYQTSATMSQMRISQGRGYE